MVGRGELKVNWIGRVRVKVEGEEREDYNKNCIVRVEEVEGREEERDEVS